MSIVLKRLFNAKRILKNVPLEGELPDDTTLLRTTLRVAWPSMVESFLVALVSVVDTMMVAQLGAAAIAAIGLTSQPRILALAPFMAIGIAVSAVVARRKGQRDRAGANRTLIQALMMSAVVAVLIIGAMMFFMDGVLHIVGTNADTHQLAKDYFSIIVLGLGFQIVNNVINAAQRGAGNTRIAMRTNVVSNGVNVVLNYLLIGGNFGFPAMGVRGAALATVIGSMVGCCMSLASILHKDGFIYLFYHENNFKFDSETLHSIYHVGGASLVENVFMRFGFIMFNLVIAKLGTNEFAAHQIGMNVILISYASAEGLSVASVALVGQSLGQKRRDLARVYASFCQRIGFVCSMILLVLFTTVGPNAFYLFTSEPGVIQYSGVVMRMTAVVVVMQVAQLIYSGCLRGAGDTRYVAMISIISVTCIRPFCGWFFVYPCNFGLLGAWIGLGIDQTCRLTMSWLRFRSGKWLDITL